MQIANIKQIRAGMQGTKISARMILFFNEVKHGYSGNH